jgi:hypothetical protein
VQFQNLMIIKGQAKHWHQVLDQLSEGVLLLEPNGISFTESKNRSDSQIQSKSDNSPDGSFSEYATSAKITYSNNSLLTILNQRDKKKDIFGIDVDDLLSEMKFKVLFSTSQVRQNLKDYILRIYRSIADGKRIEKPTNNLTASVAGLFNSVNEDNTDSEIFRTYIKLQKTKKVLEMTVQKEISTSQCLVLFKEVSSY